MLNISEKFYSIQGEGPTVGIPSIFIRLQGCNLMCGGPGGSLMKEGKATWWCDTETVWKTGVAHTNEDLLKFFEECGQLENVLSGLTHLVWTGGEPTIPRSQKGIMEFLDFLNEKYPVNAVYNEIETNGTIEVESVFYSHRYIKQINCSAKLANSGMPESMRINPKAIEQVRDYAGGWLKFVVSTEEDIHEIKRDYVDKFMFAPYRVYLMPGVDNFSDLAERSRFTAEMCKKYGYRFSTRIQILCWDKTTGV